MTTLSVLGLPPFTVNEDLVKLAGLDDPKGKHYNRDLGFFAGFFAKDVGYAADVAVVRALMRTAGERARIIAEQNAATAKQKIAEIELRTAEERTRAARIETGAERE